MRRRIFLPVFVTPLVRASQKGVRLSLGNYGMQGLSVDRALALIAGIGYDGAELCLMAGWPSEPGLLDAAARQRIREQRLPIASLLENFNLLASDAEHSRTLNRIRIAADLAHVISPKAPPILQSVLGGTPADWDSLQSKMAQRLGDWAKVAHESRLKMVLKSHIGSASDTPEKLVWLLDQVRSPALSAIYDFSHFQLLGLGLEASLETLLPRSSLVTVKDGRLVDGKPQFLLPGEGTVDYDKYFGVLKKKGYQGWMLVEISRQLQVLSGYDAVDAARKSYRNVATLLRRADLR